MAVPYNAPTGPEDPAKPPPMIWNPSKVPPETLTSLNTQSAIHELLANHHISIIIHTGKLT